MGLGPSTMALENDAATEHALRSGFGLATFAGRFSELSANTGGAPLTLAFRLVLEAQRNGEPVVWIGRSESSFFPPDVAELGVDLEALPVVAAHDPSTASSAADLLLRSGAFGLVVVDLGAGARLPIPVQTRLAGLAKHHRSALVFLTEKGDDRPSLGSLVSLRVHVLRAKHEGELYALETRALKDKRNGPGWRHVEACRGPDGLH